MGVHKEPTEEDFSALRAIRREKFRYLKPDEDELSRKGVFKFLVNTLGGCLEVPVLFYVCFHLLRIYTNIGLDLHNLLPDLFFGAAITLLLDVWIGLLYDKLVKAGHWRIKAFLTLLGAIGMLATVYFMFRDDVTPEEAELQFRFTILGLSISYTFTNTTTLKNSVNFSPAKSVRNKIFHAEHMIKAVVMLAYICFPYWLKFYSGDCDCSDICTANPGAIECNACVNNCDRSREGAAYKYSNLYFIAAFGIITIICEFRIKPRVDEREEHVPPSFNKRMAEIIRNPIIKKTFCIALLQYIVFFGVAFWFNFWLNNQSKATVDCAARFQSFVYFCTKSWLKQVVFIIIIAIAAAAYFIAKKWDPIKFSTYGLPLVVIIPGILLMIIDLNQTFMFLIIVACLAVFFTSIPVNKLLYSEGMYYDEYLTGVMQPYLLSVMHNSAAKFGFFASLAFQIICLNEGKYTLNGADDRTSDGLGFVFIGACILIFILFRMTVKHNLDDTDKIQLAIARNHTHKFIHLHFNDPVTGNPVKRPVNPHDKQETETEIISLFYYFDPRDDLKLAFHGKYDQLTRTALIRMGIHIGALLICIALVVIFFDYLKTDWGWFVFFALIGAVVSFYAALFNIYVWKAAKNLESYVAKEALGFKHSKTVRQFGRLADETMSQSSDDEESNELIEQDSDT